MLLDKCLSESAAKHKYIRSLPKLGFWHIVPGNATQKDKFRHHKIKL